MKKQIHRLVLPGVIFTVIVCIFTILFPSIFLPSICYSDDDVREAAIRYYLEGRTHQKTLFVKFARRANNDKGFEAWDPPKEFLQRLSDLNRNIKPASQAIYRKDRYVAYDPETNKPANILTVAEITRIKPWLIEIEMVSFHTGLSSFGFTCQLVWQQNKWVGVEELMEWES